MERIKLGRYQHYKGKQYEVIELARPKKMFFETVEIEVGGEKVPRFKYLES